MRALLFVGLVSCAAFAQETPEVTAPILKKNEVSMYGAPTLGQWKRSQSVVLGFPLITLKASIGLFDRLDFGLGFETYYFLTFEFLAFLKLNLLRGENWSFSLAVEGEGSFFTPRPGETRGPRWLTGHRNYGFSPQAIVTYQGAGERGARLFAQVDYLMSFDLESPTLLGHNLRTRLGAELPLSPKVSFVFSFGLDVHGRPEDAVVMPSALLGLVTGF